tara:strand:+ start:854 stop:1015 length:162 start_codon:yes stop_codon:yes gene_type:complete
MISVVENFGRHHPISHQVSTLRRVKNDNIFTPKSPLLVKFFMNRRKYRRHHSY